jgi:hypothetical protein
MQTVARGDHIGIDDPNPDVVPKAPQPSEWKPHRGVSSVTSVTSIHHLTSPPSKARWCTQKPSRNRLVETQQKWAFAKPVQRVLNTLDIADEDGCDRMLFIRTGDDHGSNHDTRGGAIDYFLRAGGLLLRSLDCSSSIIGARRSRQASSMGRWLHIWPKRKSRTSRHPARRHYRPRRNGNLAR